jgi:hypothetical protein
MKTTKSLTWRTAAVAAAALCSASAARADHWEHGHEHYRAWQDHGHAHFDQRYVPRHLWHPQYSYYPRYARPHYRTYYPYRYEGWREPEYGASFYFTIPLR